MNIDRKKILALTLLGALGTQALAANADTLPEERRGVVIGGIIGASVGGPIGAGLGAILGGGVIGRAAGIHRVNDDLRHEIVAQRSDMKQKEQDYQSRIAQLNQALGKAVSAQHAADDLDLPIQFRTDSSDIESHYQADLAQIAQAIAGHPGAKVALAGFADRRGTTAYNQQLSEARVERVREFLLAHGVAEQQVETQAYGESKPLASEETPEGDFFDRRVVMHFELEGEETPVAVR